MNPIETLDQVNKMLLALYDKAVERVEYHTADALIEIGLVIEKAIDEAREGVVR